MRVFVTCVGRCGSVSFREACRYASNFTTGHETPNGLLEYPDNHIEVNPHLRCVIGHLVAKYPDAKWVHLMREPEATIASLARLDRGAVMEAYRVLHPSIVPSAQPNDVAFRYYWAENGIIETQLRLVPATNRRVMSVETIKAEWPAFWEWIGARGNLAASITAWDVKRNTGQERGEVAAA